MIDWLSGWLREIILVVMFAVIVDMLLPNHAMQRYIKVVVSLFILLTIISPILSLIRSDLHIHEIGAALDDWGSGQGGPRIASQEEIAANAERLRQANEQQTVRWVEERLATVIEEDLRTRGYHEVSEVLAKVEVKPNGQADIREIVIYIKEIDRPPSDSGRDVPEEESRADGGRLVRPIEPIKPVVIEIDLSAGPPVTEASVQAPDRSIGSRLTGEIRDVVAAEWSVSPENIVFQKASR